MCAQSLSRVRLFAAPWTVAYEAPLSMGFSRQESWSGLPFPPPGDLPNPGIEPLSPVSPALQADSLPLTYQGSLKTQTVCFEKTRRTEPCSNPPSPLALPWHVLSSPLTALLLLGVCVLLWDTSVFSPHPLARCGHSGHPCPFPPCDLSPGTPTAHHLYPLITYISGNKGSSSTTPPGNEPQVPAS